MTCFPRIKKVSSDKTNISVVFDVFGHFDGKPLVADLTATAALGDFVALESAVKNAMITWLVGVRFGGDRVAALQTISLAYTDQDMRQWGI